MRSRIVGLAVVAAAVALVLFGIPLAAGLAEYTATEQRSTLQSLADFTSASVQEDLSHDQIPERLPDGRVDQAAIALYADNGNRLLGDGPATADDTVRTAMTDGVPAVPHDRLVVATPVSDTHDVIGVVRVAAPPGSLTATLTPVWIGMAALAALVLLVVWLLARRLAAKLSRPLEQLASDAHRLGDGDFGVRPEPAGLKEVDLVGSALGDTAHRLDALLARERAFSADASHQLRTPLAGLRLRLESTRDRPDRLTRENIDDGIAAIDRLERTVDELLELNRERRSPAIPVDVPGLLAEAEHDWTDRLATAGRGFATARQDGLPSPPASAAAVRQVVAVLLDNAYQHGSGAVRLSAREAGTDAIALDVEDEGDGAPEGSFGTPGGGRGLPLARRLAEAEGGRVTVRRSPSVVTLLLPLDSLARGRPDADPAQF